MNKNPNSQLKRDIAKLRDAAEEALEFNIATNGDSEVPAPAYSGDKHADLDESNTSALLPKKATTPAEIVDQKLAQKNPFLAEWFKQQKRNKKRWLDIL